MACIKYVHAELSLLVFLANSVINQRQLCAQIHSSESDKICKCIGAQTLLSLPLHFSQPTHVNHFDLSDAREHNLTREHRMNTRAPRFSTDALIAEAKTGKTHWCDKSEHLFLASGNNATPDVLGPRRFAVLKAKLKNMGLAQRATWPASY
jgi:hypothetical protein